jgi:hypothetical protein
MIKLFFTRVSEVHAPTHHLFSSLHLARFHLARFHLASRRFACRFTGVRR